MRPRLLRVLRAMPRRHRAVTNPGDNVVLAAGEVARHRHAEAGRNRGRGGRGAEWIVVALGALGETAQSAAGAQRAYAAAAAGQDLVGAGLLADAPDRAVARRVGGIMDRGAERTAARSG